MEQRNRKPYSEWHFICFPQPGGGGGDASEAPLYIFKTFHAMVAKLSPVKIEEFFIKILIWV